MSRLRRSYISSLGLAFMMLTSMLFSNWSASAKVAASDAKSGKSGGEQVTSGTVVVSPANFNNWFFYNDETDQIDNSLGSFVVGPATPPLGTGSVQIGVTGTQRRNLATYQFSGTPLASITTMKYSTYNPSAGNPGSPNRSAYLNFNVDFNGSDTFQRRLSFIPSLNGVVTQNTWKQWDTINGGNALWLYSGATWPTPNAQPGTTPKTWNQILADYPGVRIRVTDAFVGLRVGEPYNDGYTENLDRFEFGVSGNTTTFDFDGGLLVDDDHGQCPSAPYTSIQAAINASFAGDVINVCAGTYTEQVEINKAITLRGASQTGTIIQSPAVLATKFSTGSGPKKPIVFVTNTNAVVQNLTIDGLGLGNSNIAMVGAGFYNGGGVIDHTTIVRIRSTPLDGVQAGVGIYAFIDNATPRTLSVDNNTISDFQKNAMALNGVGLTANVTNNTVTGAGNTPLIAQNGIQIGFGGTGSVVGNVVSGIFCSHPSCVGNPITNAADGAAAILLYTNNAPSITVANNLLTDDQYGVWAIAAPALNIHDNTFMGNGWVGVSIWDGDGGTPQGTTGTIDSNTFKAQQYGIIFHDFDGSAPSVSMSGHNNHFLGNTLFGVNSNVPGAPMDFTGNWWNSPSGPSSVGPGTGDHVSTGINYGSFLTNPPAYTHLTMANPIVATVGSTFTVNLLVNSNGQPVVSQQSYLTFPTNLLKNVNPNTNAPSSTLTADTTTFSLPIQNQVCNGPAICSFGSLNANPGTIAYASGVTPPASGVIGDFRVAQATFAASTLGTATIHWQFYPPDPANRNSQVNNSTLRVSDRTFYQDFTINIVDAMFTGHVIWEGRPQASPLSAQPIKLTLSMSGTDYIFNTTTDNNGNFSVNVNTLPNGTYTWRVKGNQTLSTSGTVSLNHAVNTFQEMGLQPTGDANNDNLVDVTDFTILYGSFGYSAPGPPYDPRADFDGNNTVDITDFSLLAGNFGHLGNRPVQGAAKNTTGSAVLELRMQGKPAGKGATVHVGDTFVLELWANANAGTNIVGQQSYLNFPGTRLKLGVQPGSLANKGVLTPNNSVLDVTLQNAVCNGAAACVFNGLTVPAGSLSFASGTLNPAGGTGAFKIGEVTVQATSAGTALLHWQFNSDAPSSRSTKIMSSNGTEITQPGQFLDFELKVLASGK